MEGRINSQRERAVRASTGIGEWEAFARNLRAPPQKNRVAHSRLVSGKNCVEHPVDRLREILENN
jgi:hypothetical protein